ncbi:hypothetical protein [Acidocella sp.]|uniref:hypothetical protein n=1 Tax=Acidocella sp. TaxID=50710 RepID=UPI003CFF40BC
MILLGILFSIFGIGFMCWLIFNVAIYALPCFVGAWAGIAAYHSGAGFIGAAIIALAIMAATIIAGQLAILATPVPAIRAAIALLFAVPAAIAGYSATLGLAEIGIPSHAWSVAFAVIGGAMVGGTAWVRMTLVAPSFGRQALAGDSNQA